MLKEYESLIYIEKDNFILGENKTLHFGNFKMEPNIMIESTQVKDCSFELGMIYSPRIKS